MVRKNIILLCAIFEAWTSTASFAQEACLKADSEKIISQTTADCKMNNKNLSELGIQLRKNIDAEFDRLSEKRELKSAGHGENDISFIVQRFIHPGMSINDAEIILRHAGFIVRPHENASLDPSNYDVLADIPNYRSILFETIKVGVALRPPKAGDYSVVTRVFAGIVKTAP